MYCFIFKDKEWVPKEFYQHSLYRCWFIGDDRVSGLRGTTLYPIMEQYLAESYRWLQSKFQYVPENLHRYLWSAQTDEKFDGFETYCHPNFLRYTQLPLNSQASSCLFYPLTCVLVQLKPMSGLATKAKFVEPSTLREPH